MVFCSLESLHIMLINAYNESRLDYSLFPTNPRKFFDISFFSRLDLRDKYNKIAPILISQIIRRRYGIQPSKLYGEIFSLETHITYKCAMLVVSREILLFPLHLVGYDWSDKNSLKFQIDQRTGSLMSSIEKFCRKGICKFRSNSPPCKCHTYDKSFPIECFELETRRCPREIRSSIFLLKLNEVIKRPDRRKSRTYNLCLPDITIADRAL